MEFLITIYEICTLWKEFKTKFVKGVFMKKTKIIKIALVLILLFFAIFVFACSSEDNDDNLSNETPGEIINEIPNDPPNETTNEPLTQFSYTLLSNGTITITDVNNFDDNPTLIFPETFNNFTVENISGDVVKYGSKIKSIILPNKLKSIGYGAFRNLVNLENVSFYGPGEPLLEDIQDYAFSGCAKLNTFGNATGVLDLSLGALSTVDNYSFLGTRFEAIKLSDKVDWSPYLFDNFDHLKEFIVEADSAKYSTEEGVLFNKDKTNLIKYPKAKILSHYALPSSTTLINARAFSNCISLQSVDLNNVDWVEDLAFEGCANLIDITGEKISSVGDKTFDDTKWLQNQKDEMVVLGKVLYKYNGSQENLVLTGFASIAYKAFYNNKTLKSISINAEVTNIGYEAFRYCSNLELVTINKKSYITFISSNVFDDCSGNLKIYVPEYNLHIYKDNAIWKKYEGLLFGSEN